MDNVVLKGTSNGFEIIIKDGISYRQINDGMKRLMDKLADSEEFQQDKHIAFDCITGMQVLSDTEKTKLREIVSGYDNFSIRNFNSNVISREEAYHVRDKNKISLVGQTIRNGEVVEVEGDVLFLGSIHQGGKLVSTKNIFCMGNVQGILHAGSPNNDEALIVGKVAGSQQVRIGEQFDVISDKKDVDLANERLVVYINELNNLEYGNLDKVQTINPKFYHRIGGEK